MTTVDKAGNYIKLAQLYAAMKSCKRKEFAENIISSRFHVNCQIPETDFLKLHKSELIGCTALHLAFEEDNFTIFKLLLEKHADYNLKYNDDTNIVYRAIHKHFNRRETTKLKSRFDEFDKDFTIDELNGFIIERRTIEVKDCCKHANWRLWDKFEDRYIDSIFSACIKDNNFTNHCSKNEISYFHAACLTNNADAVDFFLKNGVDVNQVSLSPIFDGFTPLRFAVKYSNSEIVEILLTNGADVFLKDAKGFTPLHVLVDQNMKIIEWLHAKSKLPYKNSIIDYIENEEKIKLIMTKYNVREDESNFSCLSVASTLTSTSAIEKILKGNCHVNDCVYKDYQKWPGYTALHFAAHFNVEIVKLLVENGGDIEAKDVNGLTPLDILITRATIHDLHFILCQNKSWKNITLSDGKTKLLDLLLIMEDSSNFGNFLKSNNVNLRIPFDSPLWPGCTILHLAVTFSETSKKLNFLKTNYDSNPMDLYTNYHICWLDQEIYLERIQSCLDKNADVTIQDVRGWTPLNLAFRQRKMDAVKLMLEYHNKIVNPIDNDNLSHLHIACFAQTKNLIEKLVSNDANVNLAILPSFKWQSDYYNCVSTDVFDIIGSTPWHLNVQTSDLDIFKILKDNTTDVNAKDGNGLTQLQRMFIINNLWKICNEWFQVMKAFRCTLIGVRRDELVRFTRAMTNDKKIIEELLNNSTESIVEDFGLSHLHIAVYENNIDVVKKFLDDGSNVNLPIKVAKKLDVDDPFFLLYNFDGYTPLQMDVNSRGNPELEKIFLERGADVLTKRAGGMNRLFDNLVPLYSENVALFAAILKQDAAIRKRLKDEYGWTLLHVACQSGDLDLAKESVSDGVDINFQINVNSPIYPGCTALHILMMRYHEIRQCDDYAQDFLTLLLDNDADVMLTDANGNTPLHLSNIDARHTTVSYTTFRQAGELIRRIKDFNVNPINNEGISVFHIACIRHAIETVRIFLEQGVDVNQPIEFINEYLGGCTALHLTAKHRCSSLLDDRELQLRTIELLLENGANIHAEDVYGNTPLHAAVECESPKDEIFRRLVENGARINAENVYGKTPLESLLSSGETTRLELEFFLRRSCSINSFNRITQAGYIPLLFDHGKISKNDALRLALNDALAKVGFKLRTAFHNVASIPKFSSRKSLCVIEHLVRKGCHIDQQDSSGKTALHLAAQFRNDTAVEGLIACGADVNIIDRAGKTAFAYTLEAESLCDLIDDDPGHDHHLVINVFARYLYHMKLRGHYVNDLNRESLTRVFNEFDIKEKPIARVYTIIRNIRIGHTPFTLDDFLCENKAIIYYSKISEDDREVIEGFFKRSVYEYPFEDWTFLCKLQYKKALQRSTLVRSANDAVNILLGFPFPELCFEIVEKILTNGDLKNLIKASTLK